MRIGHGYDVHKFAENRRLILGGEEIPVVRSGRYFLVDVPARSGSFEAEFAE